MYKCYYCGEKNNTLEGIIDHCLLEHQNETIKYRQVILDENTGTQK